MRDFGIVKPGTTLYIPFATYDSNDPSASVTTTGLATTDIEIYKDGSVTQRGSDNGYALLDTDGIDFDGITGIHGISIDLADNSTAGFYAAGSQYWVVVSSITVDAATVNFIAATFRIGYPDAVLNTTIATLSSQTSFTLTTGPAEDDALNGSVCCIHDVASAVQLGFAVVSDYTGSTKTVTLTAGTTYTAAATDNIAFYPPANARWFAALATSAVPLAPTVAGRTLDVSAGGEAGVDWANVGSPTTTVGLSGTTVKTATDVETDTADIQSRLPAALVGGRIDANMGAISSDSTAADNCEAYFDGTGYTDVDNLSVIRANTAQAGASGSITLDASASASDDFYNNTFIQITGGTGAGQARFISDYVGSTKVATVNANWVTNPSSDSTFIIWPFGTLPGASAPTAAEVADAVWDEATSGHTTSGTFGEQCKTDIDAILVDTAEIGAAGAGLTEAGGTGDQLTAVPWNAAWDAEVQSEVTDALNAYDPPTRAELTTDTNSVLTAVGDVPTNAELATALAGADDAILAVLGAPVGASMSADIAAVKSDTAAILTDTGTTLDGKIDTIDTVVDAIKAKTDSLTFTTANMVDSAVKRVGDTTLNAAGTGGQGYGA